MIALVALAQSKLEGPKFWSHGPPLIYDGSSSLLSPSTRSRNWLPFRSDAWNVIFHLLVRSSHSSFLLKSQESLLEYMRVSLKDLVSESTALWRCHLEQLGHSQNSMWLSGWWKKKKQSFFRIVRIETTCFWKGWEKGSNIFFAVWIKSVTMMIVEMKSWLVAWLMLHLIATSSASVLVMFRAWWRVFVIDLSFMWM